MAAVVLFAVSCVQRAGSDAGFAAAQPREDAWRWDLPAGFPEPVVPADNPMSVAKVELGRRLFYDPRLSSTGEVSCATCHRQELAFTDGRARAEGATGELHSRSAMSLANVAYGASLTWADPGLSTLEEQALVPLLNEHPVEMGVAGNEERILAALREDAEYAASFRDVFPGDAAIDLRNVVRAIAAFERTMLSGDSPYDRLVFGGEMDALSRSAWSGMELFFSERLACSECHSGFTLSGPVRFVGAESVEPTFHNTGLYDLDGYGAYPAEDPGLVLRTGEARHMGAFRAPTLRNIALTGPYMHDGSVGTLDEALQHYAAGGRTIPAGPVAGDGSRNPLKSPKIRGFELDADERAALLEFLEALTDPGLVTDPALSDPRATLPSGPGRSTRAASE
ncbi:MAG: di-heme enzyme [bacterium]|nr:di-heme enzyme [bacterium]